MNHKERIAKKKNAQKKHFEKLTHDTKEPKTKPPQTTNTNKKFAEAWALAKETYQKKDFKKALEMYKDMFQYLTPADTVDTGEVYRKLGDCYHELSDWDNCRKAYEKCLEYCKTNAAVYLRLAGIYYRHDGGKAIEYYSKSLDLKFNPAAFTARGLTILKSDKYTQQEIKELFESYIEKYRPIILQGDKPYEHNKEAGKGRKKLNIGYLSADFKAHAMMQFILPLLEWHNTKKFDITLYSANKKQDSTTERINKNWVRFVDVSKLTNKETAKMIYEDEIDILVDLAGFTSNRSLLQLYKPAPIQVQYLGFVNTMGMKEIDYIFADEFVIPKDKAHLYTEKPLYLKSGLHRFDFCDPKLVFPQMTPPPFKKNGYVTFGSYNCLSKINDKTISLWADVLKKVEYSKLLIYRTKKFTPDKKEQFIQKFKALGIEEDRLILSDERFKTHYMAYLLSDVALDAHPFSGLTITTELAQMGIPVITLPGEGMQSKGTASVNKMLKLNELIAKDEEDFANIAAKLAKDKRRIERYRRDLRGILSRSKLRRDAEGLAKSVEDAYLRAWKEYINS
ncbi:MAG: hypothetical protein LBJ74_03350 [Heliobacteriaceae bacterium]|jgi:predicted O-linked N-acetylglucosamine transferase (SPINDLY family)|nr:hypothetical protein [Heliobacteriaceae bacterium]